jgi:hypothetical protein
MSSHGSRLRSLAAVVLAASCGAEAPPPSVAPPPPVTTASAPPTAAAAAPTVTRNPPLPPLAARLLVQRAPQGGISATGAVSKGGLVATWTGDDTLRLWHLASRALVRVIPGNALGALVHPVRPVWDDASREVLLVRGDGLLGVDVNGELKLRPWANETDHVQEVQPLASGSARWVGLRYGHFRLLDASGRSLGELKSPETLGGDLAVSSDGKWAVGAYDKGVIRFALDKLSGAPKVIKLPAEPTGRHAVGADGTLALTPTGDTAYVCVKSPKGEEQLLSVSNLGGAPNIRPVKLPSSVGCHVAATRTAS